MIGDSKSVNNVWQSPFEGLVNSASVRWQRVANLAAVGRSVVVAKSTIDADLAALPATPAPEFLEFRLGTNDVDDDSNDIYYNNPAQDGAPWVANVQYILDAVYTKWPSCDCRLACPYKPGAAYQAKLNTIGDTLLPLAVVGRAYAHVGDDERTYLPGHIQPPPDDIHPDPTGYNLMAQAIKTNLGL